MSIGRLLTVVPSMSVQQKDFLASNWSFSGRSRIGWLLINEEQEQVGCLPTKSRNRLAVYQRRAGTGWLFTNEEQEQVGCLLTKSRNRLAVY